MVAYFPPSDLQRLVESSSQDLRKAYPALALRTEQYREFSPLHFASPDDPPTLILHGDQDELVPIIEGRSMHEALVRSGATSRFVIVEGADHGFQGEDADLAAKEAVEWFKQHLGVD